MAALLPIHRARKSLCPCSGTLSWPSMPSLIEAPAEIVPKLHSRRGAGKPLAQRCGPGVASTPVRNRLTERILPEADLHRILSLEPDPRNHRIRQNPCAPGRSATQRRTTRIVVRGGSQVARNPAEVHPRPRALASELRASPFPPGIDPARPVKYASLSGGKFSDDKLCSCFPCAARR